MNKLENDLMEELCLVQIAFAQTVAKMHKLSNPDSLKFIATNWISSSESWDQRERLVGLYSLINFFKLKDSPIAMIELELLEKKARELEKDGF